ncbi:MAG TPA: nucleotidyltransferase family protein [Allosphingosinicella sp.]|nr:nucleotidyltransferase family protein [Allosphingosinicella sp.]
MPHPDPIAGTRAVVLAAGAGSRFGGGKLCADWNGRPLIAAAVAAALATPVEAVHVVVGADASEVRQCLAGSGDPRLSFVLCPDWAEGISASLRAGIDSLPRDTRAVIVFLGDMPMVSADLAARLLEGVLSGAPAAIAVCEDRPAHPVAIGAAVFPRLRLLEGDQGARRLLEALPGVMRVPTTDTGSVADVDTVADLDALSDPAVRRARSSSSRDGPEAGPDKH